MQLQLANVLSFIHQKGNGEEKAKRINWLEAKKILLPPHTCVHDEKKRRERERERERERKEPAKGTGKFIHIIWGFDSHSQ